MAKTDDGIDYCMGCCADRWKQAWHEKLDELKAYQSLRDYIGCESEIGAKVVLWFPFNGYDCDKKQIVDLGMKLGEVFTVSDSESGSYSSTIRLEEFPGKIFNTVNFGKPLPEDYLTKTFPE